MRQNQDVDLRFPGKADVLPQNRNTPSAFCLEQLAHGLEEQWQAWQIGTNKIDDNVLPIATKDMSSFLTVRFMRRT